MLPTFARHEDGKLAAGRDGIGREKRIPKTISVRWGGKVLLTYRNINENFLPIVFQGAGMYPTPVSRVSLWRRAFPPYSDR